MRDAGAAVTRDDVVERISNEAHIARTLKHAIAVFVIAFGTLCSRAFSMPGELNPSFGSQGVAIVPGFVPDGSYSTHALSVPTASGGMLIAHSCNDAFVSICVVDLSGNGSVNPNFAASTSGILTIPDTDGISYYPVKMWEYGDAYYLLAVCAFAVAPSREPCVHKFSAAGVLDPLFGVNGRRRISVQPPLGGVSWEAVQRFDGSVMLSYTCGSFPCYALVRESGELDTTWGVGGVVQPVPLVQANARAVAMVARPNGDTDHFSDCGGETPQTARLCVYRLDASGTLINSLGIRQSVRQSISSLQLLPDGTVMDSSICSQSSGVSFCIARWDTSIDSLASDPWNVPRDGTIAYRPRGFSPGTAMHAQRNGKPLHASGCIPNSQIGNLSTAICVWRRHADGVLDASFAQAGHFAFEVPQTSVPNQIREITLRDIQLDRFARPWVVATSKIFDCGSNGCGSSNGEHLYVMQLRGDEEDFRLCNADIDGDSRDATPNDTLLFARALLGFSGDRVLQGISFPPGSTRTTWPAIRDYLSSQCKARVSP
jgi:hypothetical protein